MLTIATLTAGCVPYPPPQMVPAPNAAYRPAPYPGGYYPSPYSPVPYYEPAPYAAKAASNAPKPAPKPRPATPLAAAPPRPDPAPPATGGDEKALPASATMPAGPECRTVTQLGYADGKEVQRQERYCRAAPGREWVRS